MKMLWTRTTYNDKSRFKYKNKTSSTCIMINQCILNETNQIHIRLSNNRFDYNEEIRININIINWNNLDKAILDSVNGITNELG